ncbi:hypothetical protein [Arthrobacter sp. PAMC25564]|uniref:hypothetical protein n=1 Tax=Arthrobacter sp. PAMC25564 TaxID=2565366 RepID=UPI001444C1E0|nr:hypothetical protein [Arthrobacter sp. PAMC25564]
MNGFFILVLAATIFGAIVYIPRAIRLDRADAYAEFHLMHGPRSGCVDCEGK